MWLFTTFGYFSVVQKDGDDELTVRARVASDLDELRETFLPQLGETLETRDSDYRYRARVAASDLAAAMVRIVAAIEYDNFKDEVKRTQGAARASVYGRVWSVLHDELPALDGAGADDDLESGDDDDEEEVDDDEVDDDESPSFLDEDADEQVLTAWRLLLGEGALERDEAVRSVARCLRDEGRATFQRLKTSSPLYEAIRDAIDRGVRACRFDRPGRGKVRAISPEPEWLEDVWPEILSWVLDDEPMTVDDVVRAAAEHARDELGLEWARLRSDGVIATAIRRGLDALVEQGLASRTADGMVALVQGEEDDVEEEEDDDEEEDEENEEEERGESEPEDDEDHGADEQASGNGVSQGDDDEPAVQVIETAEPRVVDGDRSVLVLQVPGTIKGTEGWELEGLVTQLLVGALGLTASRRSQGQAWTFFLGLDRPHWRQLSTWVGFGPGIPAPVYDLAQQLLEQLGVPVNREYAHVVNHELRPIAALTDEGLELPPAHQSTVNASDLVLFDVPRVIRRPLLVG